WTSSGVESGRQSHGRRFPSTVSDRYDDCVRRMAILLSATLNRRSPTESRDFHRNGVLTCITVRRRNHGGHEIRRVFWIGLHAIGNYLDNPSSIRLLPVPHNPSNR